MSMLPDQISQPLVDLMEALAETLSLMMLRDSVEEYDAFEIEGTSVREHADEYFDINIDIVLQDVAETLGVRMNEKFKENADELLKFAEKKSFEFTKKLPAKILKFPSRIQQIED